MDSKRKVDSLIKSALIVRFISEYCKLEKIVLSIFQTEILKVDYKYRNKLYFYYGINVGHNVFFDFDKDCVSLGNTVSYNENEMFKTLNLNKIVKFERKESLIKVLNFNVDSVVRKSSCFPFYDCCIRLMNMRNKLAHEVDTLSFQERDIIEILSSEYLKKYNYDYLEGYEINYSDENTIALLSNIVYMRNIIEKLQKPD